MAILIGADEAGYGPNLGPLLISATAWQVPDRLLDADLYHLLADVVARRVGNQNDVVAIDDSKQLYSPGSGLAVLERGVLAAMQSYGQSVASWRDVWESVAPSSVSALRDMPWYVDYDRRAPVAACGDDVGRCGERLADGFERVGIRLLAVESTAVFPARFNAQVEHFGTKGAVLSHETVALVARLMRRFPARQLLVQCDKHGGRNRYASLLQHHFPDDLVSVVQESRRQSVYRWGRPTGSIEMRFTAEGEAFLPAALASMTSKYLRELAMLAFNDFWSSHIDGLKPTAGYPTDARRFKQAIEKVQQELNVEDAVLWRTR